MARKPPSLSNREPRSRILICKTCGEEFCFTAEAQQYLLGQGFADDPKRCKSCQTKHKQAGRLHPHSLTTSR